MDLWRLWTHLCICGWLSVNCALMYIIHTPQKCVSHVRAWEWAASLYLVIWADLFRIGIHNTVEVFLLMVHHQTFSLTPLAKSVFDYAYLWGWDVASGETEGTVASSRSWLSSRSRAVRSIISLTASRSSSSSLCPVSSWVASCVCVWCGGYDNCDAWLVSHIPYRYRGLLHANSPDYSGTPLWGHSWY